MNKNSTNKQIEKIASLFDVEGSIAAIESYGSGHINDTFYLKNVDTTLPDYLLQRINHTIFKDVPALMQNVKTVTEHLREKLAKIEGSDPEKEVLTIIPLKNGQLYYQDEHGNYWRMYLFLKDTHCYDLVENEAQAYSAGQAFGKFQSLLSDLDAALLADTIPNFHNIEKRLERFQAAIDADIMDRKKEVIAEIDFLNERRGAMNAVLKLGQGGRLPLRVTHNDTKFNNVLLDKNDRVQCIIDLDTVMPGYVAYDFGDAIRTIINKAPEDEKDLEKVKLNIPFFEAYTKGYLQEAAGFLTELEIKSLMLGVLLIPYMQAVRFLTDYLEGDVYYKIGF
ncbi:MAG TPA: aminoglycoside phosphotransferase family protein, partial [Daejeonella sp.]|nr:aminoglycoside phosphotransferase family protein [Daejeonella sp.]